MSQELLQRFCQQSREKAAYAAYKKEKHLDTDK